MENILTVSGVTKTFGSLRAVDNATFSVKEREVHSLIGPNGAGKTTLFNCITGLFEPDSGQILYRGKDATHWSVGRRVRNGMARTFQITSLFLDLSVLENVELAVRSRNGYNKDLIRPAASLGKVRDKAEEIMDSVGILDMAGRVTSEIDYGDQRALEIAVALSLDPEILFLDEPTAGMAREEVGRITGLIKRLSERTAILLVEHDVDIVLSISDGITVLVSGHVLADGPPEEIRNNADVQAAYFGGTEGAGEFVSIVE